MIKKIILFTFCFSTAIANTNQEIQNLHRFFMANYYQFGQDLKNAGQWYAQIDPSATSLYAYTGYVPYLAAIQAFEDIVKIVPQLDQHFAHNYEMQMVCALALENSGYKTQAYERLIALLDKSKTNQELAFRVAQIYLERAEPENALKVINDILNSAARRPNNYLFYFLKAQIYLSLNNKKEALATIKQGIEVYPRFDKSWLLYAMLLEQEGHLEDAIKGYQHFLEITLEPKGQIERHLASLTFRAKMNSSAHKPTGDDLDTALKLFAQQHYRAALASLDDFLSAHPAHIEARLLKIQILAELAQFGTAAKLLEQWIGHGAQQSLWLQTLHLLTYIGMPAGTASQTFANIEKKYGASEQLALYQADLVLRTNPAHALPALQRAYTLNSNATIKTNIAYQIALLHYEQKQWKKAQTILEEALTHGHEYAPLHNLLAYIYSTKAKDFDRATSSIEKALKTDPANPHFLDTKAMILYKQKNYDAALAVWNTISPAATDFTISCHQGKCQILAGQKDAGLASLKTAATLASNKEQKQKAENLIGQASK